MRRENGIKEMGGGRWGVMVCVFTERQCLVLVSLSILVSTTSEDHHVRESGQLFLPPIRRKWCSYSDYKSSHIGNK